MLLLLPGLKQLHPVLTAGVPVSIANAVTHVLPKIGLVAEQYLALVALIGFDFVMNVHVVPQSLLACELARTDFALVVGMLAVHRLMMSAQRALAGEESRAQPALVTLSLS
jgi:hypothetical protein